MNNKHAEVQHVPLKLAVLGHPIKHSLSPLIHQHFAAQHNRHLEYQKIDIPNEAKFREFITQSSHDYVGFNVTVPYKQCLIDCAEKNSSHCTLSAIAQRAEAANTIAYHHPKENHHTISNTDGQGFLNHLKQLGINTAQQNILIIGAGGASMGLIAQLTDDTSSQHDAPVIYLCNRTQQKAAALVEKFAINHWHDSSVQVQFDLVINATAQGLDGQAYENNYFTQYNTHSGTYFYDLFYHKTELTPFLTYIHKHYPHHSHADGLGMLIEQAALSYHLWFGEMPNTSVLEGLIRKI